MPKPRLPKIYQEKETWKSIYKKISPETLKYIKESIELVDNLFTHFEEQFKITKHAFSHLNKKGMPDWSSYYTKSSPLFKFFGLISKIVGADQKLLFSEDTPIHKIPPINTILADLEPKLTKIDKKVLASAVEKNAFDFINLFHAGTIDLACLLTFNKCMNELINEAKQGDEPALLAVIYMDKNLVNATWVKKYIEKAALQGNQLFLNEIGEALKKRFKINKSKSSFRLSFILYVFWFSDLSKLTDPEICEIIRKYDIYTIKSPESFREFRNRLGLKRYTTQKINLE